MVGYMPGKYNYTRPSARPAGRPRRILQHGGECSCCGQQSLISATVRSPAAQYRACAREYIFPRTHGADLICVPDCGQTTTIRRRLLPFSTSVETGVGRDGPAARAMKGALGRLGGCVLAGRRRCPSVRPSRVAVNSTGPAVNQSASPASARGGQAPGAGEVNGPSGLTTARWSVLSKSSAIFLLTDYHDASLHAMRKMRPVDSTYVQWSVRMLITTVSCAKTDKPIEMSFGVWSRGAQGTMY